MILTNECSARNVKGTTQVLQSVRIIKKKSESQMEKNVLRRVLKMLTDDADLTWSGRLFQSRRPATRNARSPLCWQFSPTNKQYKWWRWTKSRLTTALKIRRMTNDECHALFVLCFLFNGTSAPIRLNKLNIEVYGAALIDMFVKFILLNRFNASMTSYVCPIVHQH